MTQDFEPHTRIADRYELLRCIGEGGMGSVWQARHLALDAPVAIKFVRIQGRPSDMERFHARFEREARLAASVRHRNVVSITDYGKLPDGTAFMVMDLLEGQPFVDYVEAHPPALEAVQLIEQVTRGLVAVHDVGIVHRDLKPENIFLVRDATGVYPKLIDFGISRHLRPDGERRSAVTTQEGVIVGTPAYMSPEQARGLSDLDHRTDVYSMGVILYEALSGKLPYDSPYVGDLILAVVTGGATPLHALRADLHPHLCDVVMKAMAREPRDRYENARELLGALSALLAKGEVEHTSALANLLARARQPPRAGLDRDELSIVETAPVASRELAGPPAHVVIPGLRRARAPWIGGGIALALIGVALGAWMSNQPAVPDSRAGVATPPKPSTSLAGTTAAAITVTLSGLPPAAQVQLDGRDVQGARHTLQRDTGTHTLLVRADGYAPWSRAFTADADVQLQVDAALLTAPDAGAPSATLQELTEAPTAVAPAAKPSAEPPRQPTRPRRPRPTAGVITELDY